MRLPGIARRVLVPSAMLFGIAWVTAGPSAQGLGDVAKREAARRQQAPAGKKYTNEDLAGGGVSAPAPVVANAAPSGGETSPAAPAKPEADAATAGEPAPGSAEALALAQKKMSEKNRPEAFWRERAKVVRAAMKQTDARLDALKTRLKNLESQLENGGGSSHVQEREVTLKALAVAQDDAKSMQAEWDRLEQRAKGENVPSDWLR